MATFQCRECRSMTETGAKTQPYCGEMCLIRASERRHGRSTTPSTPRVTRAGRLTGF